MAQRPGSRRRRDDGEERNAEERERRTRRTTPRPAAVSSGHLSHIPHSIGEMFGHDIRLNPLRFDHMPPPPSPRLPDTTNQLRIVRTLVPVPAMPKTPARAKQQVSRYPPSIEQARRCACAAISVRRHPKADSNRRIWLQQDTPSCRRFHMPAPVVFLAGGASSELYQINALIIEGNISADIRVMHGQPLWELRFQARTPVYATYYNHWRHHAEVMDEYNDGRHAYQPYHHCNSCEYPTGVPFRFLVFRMAMDARDYRILHLSTEHPFLCDTIPGIDRSRYVNARVCTDSMAQQSGRIHLQPTSQLDLVELYDSAKLQIFLDDQDHRLEKRIINQLTCNFTLKGSCELELNTGCYQRLFVACLGKSRFRGANHLTCMKMDAVCMGESSIEGCIVVDDLQWFTENPSVDKFIRAPGSDLPAVFNEYKYLLLLRRWPTRSEVTGIHPISDEELESIFRVPGHGVDDSDDEEEDDDGDDIAGFSDPFLFMGTANPIRLLRQEREMLRQGLNQSLNEPLPKPDNIKTQKFRMAPKPKTPEEQPKGEPMCLICKEAQANHIAVPCGHFQGCSWCVNEMKEKKVKSVCIECREEMQDMQVVWIK